MSKRPRQRDLQMPEHGRGPSTRARLYLVLTLLALAVLGLMVQAVYLQVIHKGFYQAQGNARFLRKVPIPVSRGTIFDRNGQPLAVSTPVESLWADPKTLLAHDARIPELAHALGVDAGDLKQHLVQRADREFIYLKRRMRPDAAKAVLDLNIPGVNEQREYKRYYPLGAVTAHVLGFTNIDDEGQEGLELAYNNWLTGTPGVKRVIRDLHGHTVQTVDMVHAAKPGKDMTLSIDSRIQYLAYHQLQKSLQKFDATSGSMVVMDVRTGEIVAMVNLPAYNPNAINQSHAAQRRNRAVTDVFEPGSTAKPFTIMAALESGKWTPTTKIDTSPGWYVFQGHTIKDDKNFGMLDVTGVITKSSNVGASKIAMTLNTESMYDVFRRFGFGQSTHSGFPGESSGYLPVGAEWRPIRQATISYGYGFSVTALQLARAYSAIADGGILRRPTFIKGDDHPGKRVISKKIDQQMINILKTVVSPDSTAPQAAVANYSVAGKTGTAHIANAGGYDKDNYFSVFAGMIPASNPRLVGVVMVRGAQRHSYFGGTVAAPVFSKVMAGAMRLLDVPPDNVQNWYAGGPDQGETGKAAHAVTGTTVGAASGSAGVQP